MRSPRGSLDHPGSKVSRDEPPVRANPLSRQETGFSGTGGNLDNRVTWLWIDLIDEPLRHPPMAFERTVPPLFPRCRPSTGPVSTVAVSVVHKP